jgi:hypothetical protein
VPQDGALLPDARQRDAILSGLPAMAGCSIQKGFPFMASPAIGFAKENETRFLEELKDLLRIPSISTLPEHRCDIEKAAAVVSAELKRIGIEHVENGTRPAR